MGGGLIGAREITRVALMAALTASGAFIRIPLPYVPLTLQTVFVLLAGAMLGARLGALSQIIYLTVGLAGVPVFAGGGGPGYVLQPTFGYLIGFIGGAYLVGRLIEDRTTGYISILQTMFSGLGVIYLCGIIYLYLNLNFITGKEIGLGTVIKIGLLIPLPGDVVKTLLAALVATKLKRAGL